MTKTDLKRTDIRLPTWAYERIEKIAEEKAIPKATILRSIIVRYLKGGCDD